MLREKFEFFPKNKQNTELSKFSKNKAYKLFIWIIVKITVGYSSDHSLDRHGEYDPGNSPKSIKSVIHKKLNFFAVKILEEWNQSDWEKNDEKKAVDPDNGEYFVKVVEVKREVKLIA